jgi:hypothetical protein
MFVHKRKTNGSSCVLAWFIVNALIGIFIVALFFWWRWAARHGAATSWELEEFENVWCAQEVKRHIE